MGTELEEGRSDGLLNAFGVGVEADEEEVAFAAAEEDLRAFCQLHIRAFRALPRFDTVIVYGFTEVGDIADNLLLHPIL